MKESMTDRLPGGCGAPGCPCASDRRLTAMAPAPSRMNVAGALAVPPPRPSPNRGGGSGARSRRDFHGNGVSAPRHGVPNLAQPPAQPAQRAPGLRPVREMPYLMRRGLRHRAQAIRPGAWAFRPRARVFRPRARGFHPEARSASPGHLPKRFIIYCVADLG